MADNSKLIKALKSAGLNLEDPIVIQDTPEIIKRHEEVTEFIKKIEDAYERTKNSTIKFNYCLTNVY